MAQAARGRTQETARPLPDWIGIGALLLAVLHPFLVVFVLLPAAYLGLPAAYLLLLGALWEFGVKQPLIRVMVLFGLGCAWRLHVARPFVGLLVAVESVAGLISLVVGLLVGAVLFRITAAHPWLLLVLFGWSIAGVRGVVRMARSMPEFRRRLAALRQAERAGTGTYA